MGLKILIKFGEEISSLVDGVTKLSKLEGRSDSFNQAEILETITCNFR